VLLGRETRSSSLPATVSGTDASTSRGDTPSFSIVIASNRGPTGIRECLNGLVAQEFARKRYEVVVVDDGSPVAIETIDEEFVGRLRLRLLRQSNAGPARARNAGAAEATGDFLAFTDDDCVPSRDWLSRLADALVAHPDAMVGGTVSNGAADDRYADATHHLIAYLERSFADGSRRRFFTTNNLALSRELFAAVGGFDERFAVAGGEDREFCERWLAQGRPLVSKPDAVVTHLHRMTLRGFVRQQYHYGRGAFRLRDLGPSGDRRLERPGFYAGLVASPFGQMPVRAAVGTSALLIVSQVATAAGYVRERFAAR
jgi:GT2 family glycosyltransferase